MKVTHTFKIPYEQALYGQLRSKQVECGKVWTDIIRYANQYYRTCKKWMSTSDLESMMKNTYDLPSQTVQALIAKYDANRKTTLELRKKGNTKAKYPWRFKYFFSIPYKQAAFEVHKDRIILKHSNFSAPLSLVTMMGKKKKGWNEGVKKQKEYIEIPNLAREDLANISYAEIVWKSGAYWFHCGMEVPEETRSLPFKAAGADLGEIHMVALATEEKALVISGRAVRSLKQYRAKMLAELSKKISRCKKGSRKYKKYARAKVRLREKTQAQLDYLYHKSTKEAIQFLLKEQVTDLVAGHPEGIEKNTNKEKKKKKKNNRVRRQQLSQWSYGRLKEFLKYKGKIKGIHVHFTEESYTSQDCPMCKGRHKAKGRRFICSVHQTEIHRDVNGAQNICRKQFPMEVKSVDVVYRQPVWYRRYLPAAFRKETKNRLINKSIA